MKLASESHQRIEKFLRDHFHDEKLRLPVIHVYSGRFSDWFTSAFGILAITFGRRIFIAPKVIKRDERKRLTVPAALIAHEATHVVQYGAAGFAGFLVSYLREYRRGLLDQKKGWGKAARQAAYFGIKQEREAYEAEAAYATWKSMDNEKQNPEVRSQNSE
jgi:hypothetical protein